MTPHELLLALAGRVDDDLLAWARELGTVGEHGRGIELVTAALVAERAVLPADVRGALVTAARTARSVLDPDTALPPAGTGTPAHTFTVWDDVPRPATATLRELLAGSGSRAWLAARRTPAGSASGPLPQPLVLVELGPDADGADVLAHQLATALDRVGVAASVEVFPPGADLPAYHIAAREAASELDLSPVDGRPEQDSAADPVPMVDTDTGTATHTEDEPEDAPAAREWTWPATLAALRSADRDTPGVAAAPAGPAPVDTAAETTETTTEATTEATSRATWDAGSEAPESPRSAEEPAAASAPRGDDPTRGEPAPEEPPADPAPVHAAEDPTSDEPLYAEPVPHEPGAPVISAWWATPESDEEPAPAADLWTPLPSRAGDARPEPLSAYEPLVPLPDAPGQEPPARTTGEFAVPPRPRPHAAAPGEDPLNGPLRQPLLDPLLDPTGGDAPTEDLFAPRTASTGGFDPGPRPPRAEGVVPLAERRPAASVDGAGPLERSPRPRPRTRPVPVVEPPGPATSTPYPAGDPLPPVPGPRPLTRPVGDVAAPVAGALPPGAPARPAGDPPPPVRPVGDVAASVAGALPPAAGPRPAADAVPPPAHPAGDAPSPVAPPPIAGPPAPGDSPGAHARRPGETPPVAERPRPHPLPRLGADGASATAGGLLPPVNGARPLGELLGNGRRPGGRRRMPEGPRAVPDVEPTTQALPEQPAEDPAPRPGRRQHLGPVPADAETPVDGEPVAIDPRLGLRPESLERMSATDRALLERLQSEMGMGQQPPPRPAPRPRPVRSDPPDIAG